MNVDRIQPGLELFDGARSDQGRGDRRVTEDPGKSQRAGVEAALGSGGTQGIDRLEGPFVHQMLVRLWAQVDARPRRRSLAKSVLSGLQPAETPFDGLHDVATRQTPVVGPFGDRVEDLGG